MRRGFLVSLCLGVSVVTAVEAHPVLMDQHQRSAVVRLEPNRARIAYRIEVDIATALLDLHRDRFPRASQLTTDEVPSVYLRYALEKLPEWLQIEVDEKLQTAKILHQSQARTDHLRCEFLLEVTWPSSDRPHNFCLRETAWEKDVSSRIALYLEDSPGVTLLSAETPDPALIARHSDAWGPNDREARRTVRAAFTEQPRSSPGRYRAALPPEIEPDKPAGIAGRALAGPPAEAENRSTPGWARAKIEGLTIPEEIGREKIANRTGGSLRSLLLDSKLGYGTLLLLAALFGAAHALTPGHGKTMVAAYLVGERGTVGHAILLGIVTTLTHTAAVLLLAALLPWLIGKEQQVQVALEFLGGLLIAIMGLFLLLRRVLGQSDHVHLFGDHSHGPVNVSGTTVRWIDLVLLGIAGGIVPCWDAIAMLAAAVVLGQLWLAFPLLLAFSAGLAFVLVAVGISVVLAKKVAQPHLERHRDTFDLLGKLLPLLTAILITVLGLWLCWDALHGPHEEL